MEHYETFVEYPDDGTEIQQSTRRSKNYMHIEDPKERKKMYNKNYQDTKMNEVIRCEECGIDIKKCSIYTHKASKRHLRALQNH